jgi:hypothetical protein
VAPDSNETVGSGLRPVVCPVLVGRDDLLELAARRLNEWPPRPFGSPIRAVATEVRLLRLP